MAKTNDNEDKRVLSMLKKARKKALEAIGKTFDSLEDEVRKSEFSHSDFPARPEHALRD